VVDPADRVLLVRFEFPHWTGWATPGGGVDPGETDDEALRRSSARRSGWSASTSARSSGRARTCSSSASTGTGRSSATTSSVPTRSSRRRGSPGSSWTRSTSRQSAGGRRRSWGRPTRSSLRATSRSSFESCSSLVHPRHLSTSAC